MGRAKRGTKDHVVVTGDGGHPRVRPEDHDTALFERLFRTAFADVTRIQTVFADKG